MIRKNFPLVFIILTSFLIFSPVLPLYFFQDDFFLLATSRVGSLADFLKLFIPAREVIWYRPLSSQVFFFVCQSLFGLNPFPYHTVMLTTHLLNIYLVFLFVKNLVRSGKMALISAFVYAVSSTHFITLAWLSTYSFILGPTFVLLTLLNYLKQKYLASVIFFVLGLLTSEVAIWTIIPLFFITYFFQKESDRKRYLKLTFFLLIIGVYFIFRYFLFPVVYKDAYSVIVSPSTFFSLFKFYIYRTIGIPMLIREMPDSLFKFIILFLSTIVLLIPLISLFLFRRKTDSKLILFSSVVFLSFLFMFLCLPFHYSPHYLTFSLIGFSLFLGLTVSGVKKTFQVIFLISYFALQTVTIKQTYETHWVVKRANLAKKLIEEKNLIHPVGSEEYFALGANQAAEVFK